MLIEPLFVMGKLTVFLESAGVSLLEVWAELVRKLHSAHRLRRSLRDVPFAFALTLVSFLSTFAFALRPSGIDLCGGCFLSVPASASCWRGWRSHLDSSSGLRQHCSIMAERTAVTSGARALVPHIPARLFLTCRTCTRSFASASVLTLAFAWRPTDACRRPVGIRRKQGTAGSLDAVVLAKHFVGFFPRSHSPRHFFSSLCFPSTDILLDI